MRVQLRRVIGWALLGLVWAGVAVRIIFPFDLHGGYPAALNVLNWLIDLVLLMPPWFLLQRVIAPPESPWVFWIGSAVYLLGLSLLIYRFLIKR